MGEELLRDGLCAELVMVWTHHVPQSAKRLLKQVGIRIPLVPVFNQSNPEHTPRTKQIHTAQYNCVTGHANQEDGWNSTSGGDYAKGWPAEVEYDATGHGPYPFLLGPVESDITQGAPMHVWGSRTQEAENFCCISGFNDTSGQYQGQVLTAVQWDWMSKMTLNGESDYSGEYYSGKVKNYTLDCSGGDGGCGPGNFYIWYYTTLDDRPVEQGEGCQVMPRTSQCSTGGSYL